MEVDAEEIRKATEFWDQTELILKEAEQISQEMVVPAISELRYAGRKLVDYLLTIDRSAQSDGAAEHLADFLQCCIRARHDALDALIAYIIQYLEILEGQVNPAYIADQIEAYREFKELLSSTSEKIVQSRADRVFRNSIYSDIMTVALSEILPKFKEIQIQKSAIFDRQRKFGRREQLASWTLAAGLSTLLASILIVSLS